jgi:serine/threonine protein kinase
MVSYRRSLAHTTSCWVLIDRAVFVAERSQNIITVKLGDFGLARLDEDETMTYVGTGAFLAPVCPLLSLLCMMF